MKKIIIQMPNGFIIPDNRIPLSLGMDPKYLTHEPQNRTRMVGDKITPWLKEGEDFLPTTVTGDVTTMTLIVKSFRVGIHCLLEQLQADGIITCYY